MFASGDADVYEIVAFHCQQAVEKYLKGVILQNSAELIGSHSLVYLYDRANEFTQLSITRKDCAYLNQYYIEARYPADTPLTVTEQDMERCMGIAKKVCWWINDMASETTL
ncbi:MAG TPA: HEPN domain-containing protein [Bacillota bacterium]|nr:HEPN domain-containing protein [Bacillota bacterium]